MTLTLDHGDLHQDDLDLSDLDHGDLDPISNVEGSVFVKKMTNFLRRLAEAP